MTPQRVIRRGLERHRPVVPTVPVTCWCELEVVRVPVSFVRRGLTASCGLPSCHEPEGAPMR